MRHSFEREVGTAEFRTIPEDPGLPGLVAMRAAGVAQTVPELGLGREPVGLTVRAHRPGRRMTLEMSVADRHLALKVYAQDPSPEVALCEFFATAGLTGDRGARVPPLVAWRSDLRILVVGWLDGPTVFELLKRGEGERAGALAARWLELARTLSFHSGRPRGAERVLRRSAKWTARLMAADKGLGTAASMLAERLGRSLPRESTRCLTHGTYHDKNILDCGDGPGVIDWESSGWGPQELDAGAFLACMSWRAVRDRRFPEAMRASRVFRSWIATQQMDERAVAWHEAAWLMCHASRAARRPHEDGLAKGWTLISRAHGTLEGEVQEEAELA